MTDRERIMDRVKRLLQLGQSDNANEAATAIAQAQRLMTKHRIEQAMLDTSANEEPEEAIAASGHRGHADPLDDSLRKKATWKGSLSYYLATHNACRTWWLGATLHMAGRPSDMATVRYLYTYCVREIDRLTQQHAHGMGRTYANNFRLGCVDAIGGKLSEEKKALTEALYGEAQREAQAAKNATALVRLDSALAKVEKRDADVQDWVDSKLNLSETKRSRARYDNHAREQGRKVGRSIDVGRSAPSKGLGAGRERLGGGS
jgi:hypothetical protein